MDDDDDEWNADPEDFRPSIPGCVDEPAAFRLRNVMGDLSEDHYAAGWLIGLEYMLFGAAFAGDGFGSGLSHEERAELITLSQRCQGWWMWSKYDANRRFVPFDEWFHMYAEHQRSR